MSDRSEGKRGKGEGKLGRRAGQLMEHAGIDVWVLSKFEHGDRSTHVKQMSTDAWQGK